MARAEARSRVVILKLSPEKLKLLSFTKDGEKILVDDHSTHSTETPNSRTVRSVESTGGADRSATDRSATDRLATDRLATDRSTTPGSHFYATRSRSGPSPQSFAASAASAASTASTTYNTYDASSSRPSSSVGTPGTSGTSRSPGLRPDPRTGLRIRLTFSDRPSVLRQRQAQQRTQLQAQLQGARRVAFDDTPQVKRISPISSSSSGSSSDSSEDPFLSRIPEDLSTLSRSDPSTSQAAEMTENGRPKLKLSFSQINKNDAVSKEASGPNSATTPGGPLKLKLNINKSTPTTTKSSTPSAKPKKRNLKVANGATPGSSAKKRKISQAVGNEEPSSDEDGHERQQPIKKVRIIQKPNTPSTPAAQLLKIKHKGKIPKRPLGSGYDSELDDREEDPTVLEGLIFRMLPGEHVNQIRRAIEENKIGVPRLEGGLDIRFTPFSTNGRRGMVEIKGTKYAFAVVDVPCIVEGMKSWDKKGWVKSIDISQMLLVLGRCNSVEEAQEYPLPPDVDKEFKYAHGITPPMKNVQKRRFNRTKRTSISAIEAVERRVNQMLADDEEALESTYEIIDYDRLTQERSHAQSPTASDEEDEEDEDDDEDAQGGEDAEGEIDGQAVIPAEVPADDEDEDIDMDLVEGMLQDDDLVVATNGAETAANESSFVATSASGSPTLQSPAQTPQVQTEDDASGDESESDEDALDDDENASEAAERQEKLEKLEEIENSLRKSEEDFKRATNPFLKNKMEPKIKSLRETRAQLREELGLDE